MLTQSYRKVVVTTSWFPNVARNRLTLVSLVGAPAWPVDHVKIDADNPGPLSHDQLTNITVTARDSGGGLIPDHFFNWSQSPAPGLGSIGSSQNVTRGGDSGQYQNRYRVTTIAGVPTSVYGPAGSVRLSFEGRSVSGYDPGPARWVTNSTGTLDISNL